MTQVISSLGFILTPQEIIATEAEKHQSWIIFIKHACQTGSPLCSNLSRYAGVHYTLLDTLLQNTRIALGRISAGSKCNTVAKGQDYRI